MRIRLIRIFSLLLTAAYGPVEAADLHFESGPSQVSLIELYSSEGCSSCPPADRWISGLKEGEGLWKEYVPAAFHVNYWDGLGWKDPFATPESTARQHAYAAHWGEDTVYTPGLVLNGAEWRDWRGAGRPPQSGKITGVLSVRSGKDGFYTLSYEPSVPGDYFQLHAVLLGFGVTSEVTAGENRGRRLPHDFLVLNWKALRMAPNGKVYAAQVRLESHPVIKAERYAAAFWVTGADGFTVLQAAGGYLPE